MVFAKEDGAGQTDAKRKGAKQMISKRPSLRDLEDSWHLVDPSCAGRGSKFVSWDLPSGLDLNAMLQKECSNLSTFTERR